MEVSGQHEGCGPSDDYLLFIEYLLVFVNTKLRRRKSGTRRNQCNRLNRGYCSMLNEVQVFRHITDWKHKEYDSRKLHCIAMRINRVSCPVETLSPGVNVIWAF